MSAGDLESASNARAPKGWPLERLLLVITSTLVLLTATLLTGLQAMTSLDQFNRAAETYKSRVQTQVQEMGATVSRTLSLSCANAMRDSDYGFLTDVVTKIVAQNPSVLQVQIADPTGRVVADSNNKTHATALPATEGRRWQIATYQGRPVYEYVEPIDFGSSRGSGRVLLRYSLEALQGALEDLEADKNAMLRQLLSRTVLLGLALALVGAFIGVYLSRRITRPVVELTRAARALSEGDLQARVSRDGRAGREVMLLGEVFNQMAARLTGTKERNKGGR
jgi:sigma-B regulation protein RsbU (phosphoserine phosphatase)